jgi:serine/threonine protein kinase
VIAHLAGLHHTCLIAVVGFSEPTDESPARVAVQFAKGWSLRDFVELRAPEDAVRISETVLVIVVCQISVRMRFLHSRGIVYENLKPENVLSNEEGHARIDTLSGNRSYPCWRNASQSEHTLRYAVPEVFGDEQYTPAAYAFRSL